MKITAKVAGYSLISYTPSLQEYGSALIYNIGRLMKDNLMREHLGGPSLKLLHCYVLCAADIHFLLASFFKNTSQYNVTNMYLLYKTL